MVSTARRCSGFRPARRSACDGPRAPERGRDAKDRPRFDFGVDVDENGRRLDRSLDMSRDIAVLFRQRFLFGGSVRDEQRRGVKADDDSMTHRPRKTSHALRIRTKFVDVEVVAQVDSRRGSEYDRRSAEEVYAPESFMRSRILRRSSRRHPRMRAHIGRAGIAAAVAVVVGILAIGCTRGADADPSAQFGDPDSVDSAARVSIHEAGSSTAMADGEGVIVVGRILEVCASAGCWFVLEEQRDGISSQIFVDLKPSADFTLPSSVRGRRATVTGTLHGVPPDRVVHATSVSLEPGT